MEESFIIPTAKPLTWTKKFFWLIFCLLIICLYVVVPIQLGKMLQPLSGIPAQLGPSPEVLSSMSVLSLFEIINIPLLEVFITFLFCPMLLKKRWVICMLALGALVGSHIWIRTIVPLTYVWPKIFLLGIYYVTFYICGVFVIYPIGKLIAKKMKDWLVNYQSPTNLNDLVTQVPEKVANNFETVRLKNTAGVFLFVFLVVSFFITLVVPSIWGLGVFQLPFTFPNKASFQSHANQAFFHSQLSSNYSIDIFSYSNSILSECWSKLPADVNQNSILNEPVEFEMELSRKSDDAHFWMTIMNSACSLDSTNLTKENLNGIFTYRFSEDYFKFAFMGRLLLDSKGSTPFEKSLKNEAWQHFDRDKNYIWMRKDNVLICANSQEIDAEQLLMIIKNFKSKPLGSSHCP